MQPDRTKRAARSILKVSTIATNHKDILMSTNLAQDTKPASMNGLNKQQENLKAGLSMSKRNNSKDSSNQHEANRDKARMEGEIRQEQPVVLVLVL
jgi:hypothetical protein